MGKVTRQKITERKVGNAKIRKTVTVTVTKPTKRKKKYTFSLHNLHDIHYQFHLNEVVNLL